MNLSKALKKKAKLVNQVNKEFEKFQRNNSYLEGREPLVNPAEALEKWIGLTEELVDLKTRIQKANQGIYHKIFMLAETKSMISKLQGVNTKSGFVADLYGAGVDKNYVALINEVDMMQMIESYEEQIETLQDEIDAYNLTTKI